MTEAEKIAVLENQIKHLSINVSGVLNLVPPFTGDDENLAPQLLNVFFTAVEQATKDAEHLRVQIARARLRGKAAEYLSMCPELLATDKWDDFKKLLSERFSQQIPIPLLYLQINTCEMEPREKVVDFVNRIKKIGCLLYQSGQGGPAHNAVIDAMMNASFKKGLLPFLRRGLLQKDPVTLAESVQEAMRLETNALLEQGPHSKRRAHVVNTVYADSTFVGTAFQSGPRGKRPNSVDKKRFNDTCFRCNKKGHFARNCNACRICNTDSHTTANCFKRMSRMKKQGNSPRPFPGLKRSALDKPQGAKPEQNSSRFSK